MTLEAAKQLIDAGLDQDEQRRQLLALAAGYKQILDVNPSHPQALAGMSLVALASNQPEMAARMAEAATTVDPRMGPAWMALGQARKASRHYDTAEQAYRFAQTLPGMANLVGMALGELRIAQDRPTDAIVFYTEVAQRNPVHMAAHIGIGHALACQGKYHEALDQYDKCLTIQPSLAEAEFSAGFALARLNRPQEAEGRYRRALRLRPDFAAAWMNLGSLLREQGRHLYAEAALTRALELRPDLVTAWLNLAILERDRKHPERAVEHLKHAFSLDPDRVDTQVTWAQFCASQKDMAGAWSWLRWALLRDPKNGEAVNMHGILLHNEARFEEAVLVFEQAERLGNKAASSNRGNSLLDLDRVEEALVAHELAVQRDPGSPGATYNLAMTRLRTGDYLRGWPGYEARWDFREVHAGRRHFRQPRWQGEPFEGQTLLLYAEQGLGDSIQFARYIALAAARGGKVLLQLQRGVKRLFQSLAVVRSGQAEILDRVTRVPEFDYECPLMSLPAVFGTTLDTVPWPGAYLSAVPADVCRKLAASPDVRPLADALRIGIAWAGNPGYKADQYRSTTLETFYPLLAESGVTWISLQKDLPARQLLDLPSSLFVWDGAHDDRDLADAAALISTLDLVITTDTCLAHLSAALGKPTWILLPHLADWRWMRGTATTPWYPTARLFRQRAQGDWAELIARVRAELISWRRDEFPLQLHTSPLLASRCAVHPAPIPASSAR